MANPFECRLGRLERASCNRRSVYVFSLGEEGREHAISRHLADHPEDRGREYVIFSLGVPRLPDDPIVEGR
jgi:hypothetical protein